MPDSDTSVTKVSQVSPDLVCKYIGGCYILYYYDLNGWCLWTSLRTTFAFDVPHVEVYGSCARRVARGSYRL